MNPATQLTIKMVRNKKGLVVHHLMERPPELYKDLGLWLFHGAIEWPSSRNGFYVTGKQMFEFYSISHFLHGSGLYSSGAPGETPRELVPGDIVIACPFDIQNYGGTPKDFMYEDSLCFIGRLPDALRKAGLLKTGVFHWGRERRLPEIVKLLNNPSMLSQLQAGAMLHQFLSEIFTANQDKKMHHYIDDILTEINQNIGNWWTIEELAETWDVSVSKLRRDFLEKTGQLPKNYIETLKMKKAAEQYLPEYSVIQTAHKLGYKDQYHFSRRFKKILGYAPSKIRGMIQTTMDNEQ